MSRNPDSILTRHIMATLPDSVPARTELLDALLSRLSPKSESRTEVSDILYHLNQHNILQRELALKFETQDQKGNGK